jgi:hypothetical protein
MAVMHLLVSGYSEGKMHEPYFCTGKQATIIHCFQQPGVGQNTFFFCLKKAREADASKCVVIILSLTELASC